MLTAPTEPEQLPTPPVPMVREEEARLVKDEPNIPVYYDAIQVDSDILPLPWWKRPGHQKFFFVWFVLTVSLIWQLWVLLGNKSN